LPCDGNARHRRPGAGRGPATSAGSRGAWPRQDAGSRPGPTCICWSPPGWRQWCDALSTTRLSPNRFAR